MRRNDTLVTLANVMENCNVQDLKCSCVFNHCSMCVNELADKAISILQRLLDKPEIRSCRIPLAIDFERMTNLDYWLNDDEESSRMSAPFSGLPSALSCAAVRLNGRHSVFHVLSR